MGVIAFVIRRKTKAQTQIMRMCLDFWRDEKDGVGGCCGVPGVEIGESMQA